MVDGPQTAFQGLPTKWIVPAVVERAVRVLERMTRPLRAALQTTTTALEERLQNSQLMAPERVALNRRFHAARQHARKLFLCRDLRSGEIVVPGTGALIRALKDFVAALDIRDHNGQLWNLHSHQFRRTFTRFVARHVLGDLYYLSHHFKHWSIDMTAYYANEAMDHELLGDTSKTREDLQQSIVARWFDDGSPFAGGAAERLTSFRSSVLTAKNRAELLSQIAEDVYIRGTGYSWCLSAPASASGSLCVFEKILCIECPNGVIDRGTRITVTSVAREAGVNRTTLHYHHADIVAQIHDLKKDGTGQQPGPQYSALAETRRQQKVLRAIIEQLPKDKERLAQHNYALRRENEGLKSQLTRKSQMLREFTRTRNAEDTVGPGESS